MSTRDARLRDLGMTYREYLGSEHWAELKAKYRAASWLPQNCMGCGYRAVQLHHRTYQRLGFENLTDLMPLCRDCHRKVHEYQDLFGIPIYHTHAIMRKIFGWTKGETKKKFAPFRLKGRPNGFSLTPKKGR